MARTERLRVNSGVVSPKERAAHHEAGHLVALLHARIPVASAMIEEEPGGWVGRTRPSEWSLDALQRQMETPPDEPTVFAAEDRARITAEMFEDYATGCWAGPIAERALTSGRHVKRPDWFELADNYGGWGDITNTDQLAAGLGINRWRTRTLRAAVDLVRENWDDVQEWAMRLTEDEELVLIDLKRGVIAGFT